MDLLHFITAGSVDDGKSTLIGRLLYDSKSILADQLEAIRQQTKNRAEGEVDLALLTDGLRAEREQGITIDVAYRYFSTPNRKFIIADAPGHIQYTRNMVTGASAADLIIVLVDARHGVVEQTRRHSIIAALLQIPHVVVAVNKMDLVNYSEDVFLSIVNDYAQVAQSLQLDNITYIPVSALTGDNIVERSGEIPWYEGPSLLELLESVTTLPPETEDAARFQVQYVIRPQTESLPDYRGYAGKILSGRYREGESVTVLPAGITTTIKAIETGGRHTPEATFPQSVILHLTDDIDISRGDTIVPEGHQPLLSREHEALICWLDSQPLQPGKRYLLQHNSKTVHAVVQKIAYKIDVNTLEQVADPVTAVLNEVVKVSIKTSVPLAYDSYTQNRYTGSAILIDETGNGTVGAVLFQ